jgi:hypothetical protein
MYNRHLSIFSGLLNAIQGTASPDRMHHSLHALPNNSSHFIQQSQLTNPFAKGKMNKAPENIYTGLRTSQTIKKRVHVSKNISLGTISASDAISRGFPFSTTD